MFYILNQSNPNLSLRPCSQPTGMPDIPCFPLPFQFPFWLILSIMFIFTLYSPRCACVSLSSLLTVHRTHSHLAVKGPISFSLLLFNVFILNQSNPNLSLRPCSRPTGLLACLSPVFWLFVVLTVILLSKVCSRVSLQSSDCSSNSQSSCCQSTARPTGCSPFRERENK
jgi:hypothetical protein